MKDRFKGLLLHHDLVDWSRSDLDADVISGLFIGSCAYWGDEEFAGMGPHEIEREILLAGGRDQWYQDSPYGKPYYQHFLTLMKVLFPKTDITPSIADAVMFFCKGLGFKKILNLIGCQNAGKSAGAIRIVFTAMFIDPRNTVAYVANPFDNAADSTVWGDVEELWDELCEAWPNPASYAKNPTPSLFPNGTKYANKSLVFIPNIPKAGHISLRNVKHVGKYKGSKTHGKETHHGIMFVIVDEINEIDNFAFLTTLENISSQDAFFGITSQNFKDEEDMGGQITQPIPTFGGPTTFDDLDIEIDQWWHSAKSSVTLRFDGHRSPNILADRVIYPYLFKRRDMDRLLESGGGEQSLIYYSQARSFPIRGGENVSVLSSSKLSASRHKDPLYQLVRVTGSVAFCDPAFGGRDAAVYGSARYGVAAVTDSDGQVFEQEIIEFTKKMVKLKIVKDAVFNDFWFARMREAGIKTGPFTAGAPISPEDQIAIQCKEEMLKDGVSASGFGFDFSMRPDIVSSVNRIIGFEAVAFDYNQNPLGCMLHGVKQQSEDYCYDRVSELAFLTADLFLMKQVRGGEHIEPAIVQLQRTNHEAKGKKRKVEKKAEFKARWQGRSPDERDTLMGISGMAILRGFRQEGISNASTSGSSSLWAELNSRNFGKSRITSAHRLT